MIALVERLAEKFDFAAALHLPGHSFYIGYSTPLSKGLWADHEHRQNTISFGVEFDIGFADYSENGKEWYEVLND